MNIDLIRRKLLDSGDADLGFVAGYLTDAELTKLVNIIRGVYITLPLDERVEQSAADREIRV